MNKYDYLNIIYKLAPKFEIKRKKTMIDCFSYKTDKVHLLFENLSDPHNAV